MLPPTRSRHLSPAERRRVAEVLAGLREGIGNGQLVPGQIVTYPQLCDTYSTCCAVVAAALWLLRRDGLMETRPRLGTRVVIDGETWNTPGRDTQVPLTVYVESIMRERLADRIYPPSTRIPTLDLLAEEFGVSVATVRGGLDPLFAEFYLLTQPRRDQGTMVTNHVNDVPRHQLVRLADRPSRPRGTRYVVWGESKTLAQWSRDERCAVTYTVLKARFITHEWPLKEAITTPAQH